VKAVRVDLFQNLVILFSGLSAMRAFRLLGFAAFMPIIAAASDFSGVWTAAVCPNGVKYAPGKCSQFVLELFQKQDRVCGSHVFATASASMVDEGGAAPSITGSINEGTAAINLLSNRGRAQQPVTGELKLTSDSLHWKRTDKPGRDDLLPPAASFSRSRHKTLMNPVYAQQLSAACNIANTPVPPAEPPKQLQRAPENTPPLPARDAAQN
jgi:hypothetical protein